MKTNGATSGNEWYNQWKRMTTSDNKWQQLIILANFLFFWRREEPLPKHPKEKASNFDADLEEDLLNWEQKQAPGINAAILFVINTILKFYEDDTGIT